MPSSLPRVALVLLGFISPAAHAQVLPAAGHGAAAEAPAFADPQVCAVCHYDIHARWDRSRHSKMVQKATLSSVKGDFARGNIVLDGLSYGLHQEDGQFFITESYITRKPVKRRVEYTLGNRRIQHYLTTLPDGKMVLLVPTWDVQRQEWFHNMEIVDPEVSRDIPMQVWNKDCLVCHVSGSVKKFDGKIKTYETGWHEFGTNCERCHGPGEKHATSRFSGSSAPDSFIVKQTNLDAATNSMVCAQCHSYRAVVATGFTPGDSYYDYFMPLLEFTQEVDSDPTWWADGRTRRFSNNAMGIWQSRCFLEGGLTCTQCHVDSHAPEVELNSRLRPENNELCTRCHEEIGAAPAEHSRHKEGSTGSSCVECHMPYTVVGVKATMRDHTLSVPVPENTRDHGITNACNSCHGDRTAEWAIGILEDWFPGSPYRAKWVRRAATFARARAGDAGALEPLLALAARTEDGPVPRANALGYLGRYAQDPRVAAALLAALKSEHPLPRAVAAQSLGSVGKGRAASVRYELQAALADPVRSVRSGAALSLLELGVSRLEGAPGTRFETAKRDLEATAALHPDYPHMQSDLGRMRLLNGEPARAEESFMDSLRLQPEQPRTLYSLAVALLAQGKASEARGLLERFQEGQPFYTAAQTLLRQMDSRAGGKRGGGGNE